MKNRRLEELSQFNVQSRPSGQEAVTVENLSINENSRAFFTAYMNKIQAPNLKIAASLFIKHYARVTIVPTLAHLAKENGAFRLPPAQISLAENYKTLYVRDLDSLWVDCSSEASREQLLSELFAQHITPFLKAIKETTAVSHRILWENVAVRINSHYRKMLKADPDKEVEKQLIADFNFLKQADGRLFHCNDNPLSSFLQLEHDGTPLKQRRTCCFNYLVGKQEYCTICPLTKTALNQTD
ncbi:siderophore-iron reductase FhuF [Alkalihalobacillus xiaoxiensis]|uniref:Siderophore-iron reductase FhuF n=1 Tax=Shouchella xiaoxiensis TaxID=766895 RepID=A0ABS2SWE6_9BACI|nr:siderophore-iron reductase FhuF [Shouchella xiaoxiensis]MBM7839868.1 siderophore-iron reductase FhuF [Shouchella xiaoxiensis]